MFTCFSRKQKKITRGEKLNSAEMTELSKQNARAMQECKLFQP